VTSPALQAAQAAGYTGDAMAWFGLFAAHETEQRFDVVIFADYPGPESVKCALERIVKSGKKGSVRYYDSDELVAGYVPK